MNHDAQNNICLRDGDSIKAKELDQFYTNPCVADLCIAILSEFSNLNNFNFIEPSAGAGAFLDICVKEQLPVLAFDLDPKTKGIVQKDFLTISAANITFTKQKKLCFIGNPPFGTGANMAKRFFNHAAQFADVIAFILPRTFKKTSVRNRINHYFHCVSSTDMPKNSFCYNGMPYDVPCCFQIWVKTNIKRESNTVKDSPYFDFVAQDIADIAVRRAGGRAGHYFDISTSLSKQSNYFLRLKNGINLDTFKACMDSINFKEIVSSTAGVRSLSKHELIILTSSLLKTKSRI